MKHTLIALLLAAAAAGYTLPRPRFEMVYTETAPNYRLGDPINRVGPDVYANDHFVVWHDKETGQEIVCLVRTNSSPSCWLTGRKW